MKFKRALVGILLLLLLAPVAGCSGSEQRKAQYTALAQQHLKEGDVPKARAALRNVLAIDPKDAQAYFLCAQLDEKEKNWREAFNHYLKAIELDPYHREALIKIGKLHLERREHDKVLAVADKILARYPGEGSAEALKASVLAATGHLSEATTKAEEIISRHPTEPDTAMLVAALYAADARSRETEAVLRRAIAAHPDNVELLTTLGATLVRVGTLDGAEQIYRQVVELEPRVFDHHVILASFYDYQKNHEKAEAVLREAVKLEPNSEERRLALAGFLTTRKGSQYGEAALLEARTQLPQSVTIRFALAKHYELSRQGSKARLIYEAIADEQKTSPLGLQARVKLAALAFAEGEWETADRGLQEVLKDNAHVTDALVLQGKIALARRNGKAAVQAFQNALKEQPEAADVQRLLGRAHLMQGQAGLTRENFNPPLPPAFLDTKEAYYQEFRVPCGDDP